MTNLLANISIGERIASGHFGSVYHGVSQVLGPVAVKIFVKNEKEKETEEDWSKRKNLLLTEGQRLKDAEHTNIVKVFQILESQQDDSVYLVMELCEKGSLAELYNQGPISIRDIRTFLTDVALGLQVIHSRGMLHRDIKPSNILLGQDNRAKIGDFGLVTDDLIYGYASAAGYLDHLAKEVYENSLTSVQTDVWALGMTAYRLLHGKRFYEQLFDSSVPIPDMIQSGGFARKLHWLPHVPSEWKRFVRKAMNDEPYQRFVDASDILHSLSQLPVEPNWNCVYTSDKVGWSLNKNNRKIEVEWHQHSERKHEWAAYSFPAAASGKKRKLGSSDGIKTKRVVLKELSGFLNK